MFKEDISKFPMADTVLKALETNKAEERINDGDNLYFVIKNDGKKVGTGIAVGIGISILTGGLLCELISHLFANITEYFLISFPLKSGLIISALFGSCFINSFFVDSSIINASLKPVFIP